MAWRIGIDIGGTFTDVALVEESSGRIGIAKVLTTPRDFAQGVMRGIGLALQEHGVDPSSVSLLAHATTVVTNALLEKKGARAGFIGTRGFGDLLELRRSSRRDLYDLFQDAPAVLVPRRWRFEISERIDAQGDVVTKLDEQEVAAVAAAIQTAGLQTVGISLLFSFLNDTHERRLGDLLRSALPDVGVFLSCDVLPEIREFERASTTAVCAYVGPLLAGYLGRLQSATSALGLPDLHVMGSSGGVIDIAEALRMPAAVVEFRTRRRRDRGGPGGASTWPAERDLLRHGRHDRESQRHCQRRDRGDSGIRSRRFRQRQPLAEWLRPSDPRAGDRSGRGQRRRRQHSLGRSRGLAAGGATQRRG